MALSYRAPVSRSVRLGMTRITIIAAGLLLIAFLSYRIEWLMTRDPRLVLLGLSAVLGLGVSLRYGTAQRGMMSVVVTALFVNFVSLPTGRESRVVVSFAIMLALLAVWAYRLALRGITGARVAASPLNRPVLVYIGINLLAYVWSILTRDALLQIWDSFPFVQIGALVLNITLPLTVLYVINHTDDAWLRRYVWLVASVGLVNGVWRLFNLPVFSTVMGNGTTGIFAMWAAAIAYGLLLYDKSASRKQKAMLLGVLLLSGLFYFWRQRIWLSGWLPIAAALGVMTLLYSRRLSLIMALVLVVYAWINQDLLYRTIIQDNISEGGLQRLEIWQMNLKHVANHPVFGMGPAGYAIYNMTYHPRDARSTHNNFFDILAQNGVVGMLAFAIMMFVALCLALRVRAEYRGQGDYKEAYANAALAGIPAALIAMMLGDWVLPFAYNVTIMGFDHAVHTWIAIGLTGWLHLRTAQLSPPAAHTKGQLP
jgi:O-antigen ligase